MRLRFLMLLLALSHLVSTATAGNYSKYLNKTVVIVRNNATFQSPSGKSVSTRIGDTYAVDKVKDTWLWSHRVGAWIDARFVLSPENAVKRFTDQLLRHPTASAYLHRGLAFRATGDFKNAIRDFSSVLQLEPKHVDALNGRGNAHLSLGQYKQAIEDYTMAINVAPESAAAYNNRGNAFRALKMFDQAIPDFDKAIAYNPGSAAAYNNRGNCQLSNLQPQLALNDYTKAILIDRNYVAAYNNRGYVHYIMGDYDQAIADYSKAAQYDAGFYRAFNNAAWLRATCPNPKYRNGQLAVRVAQRACDITKHEKWYCVGTLAAAYAEAGDFNNAIQTQQTALGLMPKDVSDAERQGAFQRLKLFIQRRPYRTDPTNDVAGVAPSDLLLR